MTVSVDAAARDVSPTQRSTPAANDDLTTDYAAGTAWRSAYVDVKDRNLLQLQLEIAGGGATTINLVAEVSDASGDDTSGDWHRNQKIASDGTVSDDELSITKAGLPTDGKISLKVDVSEMRRVRFVMKQDGGVAETVLASVLEAVDF